MERPYNNSVSNNVTCFIGTEVEHTLMFGKRTLFVVGTQDIDAIVRVLKEEEIEHVYLGANMSFSPESKLDWDSWDKLITSLLEANFWVTLDYDHSYNEEVIGKGYNSYNRFIAMISVKFPFIDELNYNACIKIDDKGFDTTNPGVWVHKLHKLQCSEGYTDWSKYTKDKPVNL